MPVAENKINNIQIEVLKAKDEFTEKTVVGYNYFNNPIGNTFLISKKLSGKTNVIYNIVKNTITKRTEIIIFSGSHSKDPKYAAIKKFCKDKEIKITCYDHFLEGRTNHVEAFFKKLQDEDKNPVDERKSSNEPEKKILDDSEDRPKRKKKRKIVPRYLMIFDDIGASLRSQSIATACKYQRHYKVKCIYSFHSASDLYPTAICQGDHVLLFKGFEKDKLENLHSKLKLSVTLDEFERLYEHATIKPYSFLYIDVEKGKFRCNFDTELSIN